MNNIKSYTPLLLPLAAIIAGISITDFFSLSSIVHVIGFVCSLVIIFFGWRFNIQKKDALEIDAFERTETSSPTRSGIQGKFSKTQAWFPAFLRTPWRGFGGHVAGLSAIALATAEMTPNWLKRKNTILSVACCSLVCFIGGLLFNVQKHEFETVVSLLQKQKITIIGTVLEKDPWQGRNGGELLRISLCEVYHPPLSYHQHFSCDVLVYTTSPTHVEVDDLVQLKYVEVKPSTNPENQKPSYQDYLFKEGIVSSLFIAGGNQISTLHRSSWSMRRTLWKIRKTISASINAKLNPETRVYFNLIFLGNKHQENNTELREFFGYWGLSHYLARSGLHIVLFIIMWTYLLCMVPIHLFFKRLLLIVICVMYDLVSWTSVPFARAYYAFLLMKVGELLGLQINYLHILSLLCMSMLLFNPLLILFLDFQLTFLLTFILIIISYRFSSSNLPPEMQSRKKII